jgi:Tol biopolymer transport system component
MSAILKEEPPDLSSTNHNVSPSLERLVDHCLEKNPAERFHSARDLAFALEAMSGSVATTTETVTTTAYAPPRLTRRELVSWLLSGLFLLVALGLTYLHFRSTPTNEKQLTRFYVDPPERMSFNGSTVSPDGRNLLFEVNAADGKRQLWIRSLGSLAAQPIPGTEDGGQAFWSPDSRFIGFFASGKLKKVDTYNGTTQVLADVQQSRGGSWSREGVIVFAVALGGGLFRVPAAGGSPIQVTTVDSSGNSMAPTWPQFLPDGYHFIYLDRSTKPEETGIYIGSLDSTESKLLVHSGAAAVYAHPGYLLFLGESVGPLASLMAQPFDVKSLQLSGEPKPVVQDVAYNPGNGRVFFCASDNGILIYRTGFVVNRQLTWFSRTGEQLGTLGTPDFILGPSLSSDDKRLAIMRGDLSKGIDIWLVDVARGTNSRFTFGPAIVGNPIWSPDGSRIVFSSNRAGVYDLYGKPSNGAGNEELLLKSNVSKFVNDWSSDGRFILYQEANAKTQMDLWVLPLFDDKKPVALEQSGFNEGQGKFSPDGHWIAYVSNESGNNQVYVRNFPPGGGKWMVSINGGTQPRWRKDGKELFYLGPANKLMAVQVKSDGTNFEVGTAVPLFEANIAGVGPNSGGGYVVTHDGQRFLLNLDPKESKPTPMIVVENWIVPY